MKPEEMKQVEFADLEAFKGINPDYWIHSAQMTIAYNVLESVEKYALAVNYFEKVMVFYTDKDEYYQTRVLNRIKRLKGSLGVWKNDPNKRNDFLQKVADIKLRELYRVIQRKSIRSKIKTLDGDAFRAEQEQHRRVKRLERALLEADKEKLDEVDIDGDNAEEPADNS